jgi:hypothetical protein
VDNTGVPRGIGFAGRTVALHSHRSVCSTARRLRDGRGLG